jgi:Mg2+/Co2+ transporter CorB
MGIIDQLLKEIPSDDITIQIKEMCNKIWEEEKDKIKKYHHVLPSGANIFLALQVPAKAKRDVSFLTLERDPMDEYISNYYSIKETDIQKADLPQMPRRYQSHRLEGRSSKKILIEFAKLVKFYRGE